MYLISPAMKSRAKQVGSALIVSTVGVILAACGTDPKPQMVVDLTCGSQQKDLITRYTTEFKEYQGTNPRLVEAENFRVTFLKGEKDYLSVESFKKAILDKKILGKNTVDEAYQEMCRKMDVDIFYEWEDQELEIDDGGGSYGG
jgi:hypothetical protein